MTNDPTGLLIIRAWVENGSSEPLRAQVRLSTDIAAGIERQMTLTQVEDVCVTVEEWLASVLKTAGE